MIVFAIIGPCGAGKTTLLEKIPGNIRTHKEGYVQKDAATIFIDNRTYLSKLRYLSSWYLEMIKLKRERHRKIVSDRCPYDVCAYVEDAGKQHELVDEYMRELDSLFGVRVQTIYVRVSFAVARKRVADRLAREPWRKRYHEDDDVFLRKTHDYYESRLSQWHHIIDNNGSLAGSVNELRRIIGAR